MKEYKLTMEISMLGEQWEIPLVVMFSDYDGDVDIVDVSPSPEKKSTLVVWEDLLFPQSIVDRIEEEISEHIRRSKNTYTKEGRE